MSNLNKSSPGNTHLVPTSGLIDPTVELTQPGGPFPYGEALLTDGAGGYTIAATLRPYILSFRLPRSVAPDRWVHCEHQGVDTSVAGVPIPLSVNLIGVGVMLSAPVEAGHSYSVEVFKFVDDVIEVVATIEMNARDGRRALRRNLSVGLGGPCEIGVTIRHRSGPVSSYFGTGLVSLELEG